VSRFRFRFRVVMFLAGVIEFMINFEFQDERASHLLPGEFPRKTVGRPPAWRVIRCGSDEKTPAMEGVAASFVSAP